MKAPDSSINVQKTFSLPVTNWTCRLVWTLWGVALVLMALGHTVTTYGAGMVIPDWPTTYGHLPFLLPPKEWFEHWDIFLAYSHRLVAIISGLLSLVVAAAFWRTRQNLHKWLATAAVFLVCLQVALGGLRVLTGDLLLVTIHACTGPVYFGLVTVLAVIAGSHRKRPSLDEPSPVKTRKRASVVSIFVASLAYLQLVLIAQLRHVSPQLIPTAPLVIVWAQVIIWGILGAVILGICLFLPGSCRAALGRMGLWLISGLYMVNVLLGILAWIVNFNLPPRFAHGVLTVEYTVVQAGAAQAVLTTAFVLVTSLLFATSLVLVVSNWLRE
ncbi:MAG TPA: COX15/CtaA family protein [Thermogutta sp.]|nr:COX15/CtaA family protein [Thermogutta sp.]HOP76480.1 COX15/CtaA family protein [Thermogutta sp.]HPU07009.1 COX15/CtaA family protein [Thermogutta sp.]HQF13181.1 COX15/CtaA family protein [Thermogutta sp.]